MIRVLELFAGIGACSKALTRLGIDHTIVDAVEIDKYAIQAFNTIHGTNFEPQDIREQADMLEELQFRGYRAVFAVGFEEVKKIIDEYLGSILNEEEIY